MNIHVNIKYKSQNQLLYLTIINLLYYLAKNDIKFY